MKKTILHISKYYYPYKGGIEFTAQVIAEGLKEYTNIILCFNLEKNNKEEKINDVDIYRASNDLFIARQSISFSYRRILKKILKEYNPELILFHCPNPFVYAILLPLIPQTTKLVLLWHSDIIQQKFVYKFIKLCETALLRRADLILTTSPNYRDHSLPLSNFRNKTDILASAIFCDTFDKRESDDAKIKDVQEKYNKPIVFFVGRHVPYKGITYLIEAEKYIKSDCVIVIAGDGPLTISLKEKCINNDRIKFVGRISDDELRIYLYASKILAFPSITKNEAFGLVLAQGMYCGCIPVTFEIVGSGVNWVSLNNITGLEIENLNVQEYANGIDRILMNESLYSQFARNARKRVLDLFTVEREQQTVNKLFKRLLDD